MPVFVVFFCLHSLAFFKTAAQRAGDKKDNDSTVSGVDSGLVRDMRGVGYVGV